MASATRPGVDPVSAVDAFHAARDAGDVAAMAEAALRLPSSQRFGAHPGQIPALVHEAYVATDDPATRCALAAALARAWAYGGDAARASGFAQQAVDLAEALGDAELTDALDAALVSRWGPDDFLERLALSARLIDAAAHLSAPGPRLSAHQWRLTTAWECLDLLAVQRQLRALELLAADTGAPRDAFFATARRAMYALVVDSLDEADRLIAQTKRLGAEADEPDADAVAHSLDTSRATRVGDTDRLLAEAADFEAFGTAQGIVSIVAQAAVFWLGGGAPDRAADLVHRIAGPGLDSVVRDVDYLLTLTSLVDVAAGVGLQELAEEGARLLEPYAGRAVLNAGAVSFHGVVEDYLYRAARALDLPEATRWRHTAASAYERIGARWWRDRLEPSPQAAVSPTTLVVHLHEAAGSGWTVGRDSATTTLPDLKGLRHLRELLRNPGRDVAVLALAASAGAHAEIPVDGGGDELADPQALAAYRDRLRDIDQELDEADSWADEGRVAALRLEREALLGEVRAATGLAGRPRRFASNSERARTAVRKAITATLQRIEDHDPTLARLLRDTVHTGAVCRYDPDPARPVTWLLEQPTSVVDA